LIEYRFPITGSPKKMKLSKKRNTQIKWTARILSLAILIFGLPFYFGYGNPLPFINPDYSVWDNIWLTVFPFMFVGLALGWKFEKFGGYLVTVPIVIGFFLGLIVEKDLSIHMFVPLIAGTLYLFSGYSKEVS
jgi:hypothetical protein